MTPQSSAADTSLLARGGRTSFVGFILRLGARLPFLFIAGQLYGAKALGLYAYATMVIELMAQLATLGLKRGLAAELATDGRDGQLPQNHIVADGLLLAWIAAMIGAALLIALPGIVFPNMGEPGGGGHGYDRWLPIMGIAIVTSDVALAAMAFRNRLVVAVTARSVIEPWTLALAAFALAFTPLKRDGLLIAYALSMAVAMTASLVPLVREFGIPRDWRPRFGRLLDMARGNLPLAGADAAEWGSRRLDIFILGRFAGPEIVGIYFIAQQVATLPNKLKASFDSILAPVVTRTLARDDLAGVAAHIRQVGFWIGAAQLGAGLALGFTGGASLALFGRTFADGVTVLALLLAVEFFAAQAAVAEAALIFVRRKTNLALSVAGLVLQTGVSLLLVQRYGGAGVAAGLAIASLFLALVKVAVLRPVLGAPVLGWRWSMLIAAIPTIGAGLLVQRLPNVLQLAIGVPVVFGLFCVLIWTIGFRGTDRLLFAMRKASPSP